MLTEKAIRVDGDEAPGRARPRGPSSAKDIADAYGIPAEALAKILQRLVKAGLYIRNTEPMADTRWQEIPQRFQFSRSYEPSTGRYLSPHA